MGQIEVHCNNKQLASIIRDFEDASIPVEVNYGVSRKGKTILKVIYDNEDDGMVAGIIQYRMKTDED